MPFGGALYGTFGTGPLGGALYGTFGIGAVDAPFGIGGLLNGGAFSSGTRRGLDDGRAFVAGEALEFVTGLFSGILLICSDDDALYSGDARTHDGVSSSKPSCRSCPDSSSERNSELTPRCFALRSPPHAGDRRSRADNCTGLGLRGSGVGALDGRAFDLAVAPTYTTSLSLT